MSETTVVLALPARQPLPRRLYGFLDRHAARIALAAGALYAVVGTAYAVALGGRLRYLDERVYVGLARGLVDGRGYTLDGVNPTAYRPPGYPFMLAVLDALGGGVVVMRLLGVAALVGLVWLGYRFGTLVHGRVAGALAAVFAACYPLLVFTAGTLYPQVHAAFLLLLGCYLGLRATGTGTGPVRTRWWYALNAGLAFGVLVLAVPTFAVSVAAVLGWLGHGKLRRWRAGRADGRDGSGARGVRRSVWAPLAVLLLATAALPAAWCARNAVRLHAFIPVSTNNGVNLILGNSEHATAGGGRVVDISDYEQRARDLGLSEVEQDAFYRDEALRWIRSHPGDAAALYVGKVANNFNFRNELATSGQNNTVQDVVSALSFYPLLLLFVLRLLVVGRRNMTGLEKLLAGIVLGNVLLLAVFYTRLRFRVPLDAVMLVSSAAALAEILHRWSNRSTAR